MSSSNLLQDAALLVDEEAIRDRLAALRDLERRSDGELRQIIGRRNDMEIKISSLGRLLPQLSKLGNDARELCEMVGSTCALAENISSKVRELDLAKSHLQLTIKRVDDIVDLKGCMEGAQAALAGERFEEAAAFIHRYLSIDKKLLESEAAYSVDAHLVSPYESLNQAQDNLVQILRNRFDQAVLNNNKAEIDRFFKLFPFVMLHEEGLSKYARYLNSQIAKGCDSLLIGKQEGDDATRYVDAITTLFEKIAKTIENAQPAVETHYGPGYVVSLISQLQTECDTQASRILQHFLEGRRVTEKLAAVAKPTTGKEESIVEPLTLDPLLVELTTLMGRCDLYFRFVAKKIGADIDAFNASSKDEVKGGVRAKVDLHALEKIQRKSDLSRELQSLTGKYISLEEFFLSASVRKALSLDSRGPNEKVSTAVDDVFFIMSKVSRRALSSCSVDCFCAMLNHIGSNLVGAYLQHFQGHLDSGYPTGGLDLTALHGKLQMGLSSLAATAQPKPAGRTATSATAFISAAPAVQEAQQWFMVVLNNLQVSTEYAARLVTDCTSESTRVFSNVVGKDRSKLDSCLSDLGACQQSFKRQISAGLVQVRAAVVEPKIKELADEFLSVHFELSEEDLATFDPSSPCMSALIAALKTMLNECSELFTKGNFDDFVLLVAETCAEQLERVLAQLRFNRIGGLQLERDLRVLSTYLAAATQWSVRDRLIRLSQMSTLLNLEKVSELSEYWGQGTSPLTWRLTPAEARRFLKLRVDFKAEDISRLKL
eukprot:m.136864 g.136864  ORF g.136864 m.136864 type:complete len:771 (+) comp16592_c0_seq1:139-2451(+)